jgi:hypothetical protein
MKEWAQCHGLKLSAKGRISQALEIILDPYHNSSFFSILFDPASETSANELAAFLRAEAVSRL